MRNIQLILKRMIDIFISLTGLIVLSPVFLVISIMIYFKLGSPVFFIQKRPGKNGKIFKMIKFRTMLDAKDKNENLLPDEKRLTSFGKFLRSSSLDELPELINVLKGEMSLVGPRPLLVEYLPRYNEHQARRHEMRPGITGLAQVNGRNTISWEDKFNYDVKYIDNFSMLLDLKIIFKTFSKVFKREDISSKNHATMEKFNGTDNSDN
ncbi:lipopolysaccharide/colanic/teichoic acid biosynthesis glycosyltransferase [Halanaerobium saccharolyticum]|uniref:Lipopolysaccharide/colanic/teichoic acid biosynthesis glycosyltransferase n=1 Tax=Halanaerobium saccharolyticum TaxID=43595 RepID=A0A4R6R6X5_9FIRM|nr:sugar transferase [Halanaerobium saccharolyticum]TDP81564.1 lipopolysaccharide/colanic/teichoic acid biosynthesis glycosyltransferase [Halanaerobium saccharolyticum]